MGLSKATVSTIIDEACNDEGSIALSIKRALAQRENRIDELEGKVEKLELENAGLKVSVDNLNSKMTQVSIYIQNLERLTDDNSQYSRKNNLIVDGLKISKGDKDSKIREIFLDEIRRLDLDVDEYEVDRAHRIESPYRDRNGKWHVPIIVRFTSWHARNIVYESRKSMGAFIRADLTHRRKNLLYDAKERISEPDSRAAELFSFVYADRNWHISIKSKDDCFFKISSMEEFDRTLDYVEDTQPTKILACRFFEES